MKRVRQSIIILAVIAALIFLSVRVTGLQMSQEKLLSVKEAELHFGPSDEVLYEYTGDDGSGAIISKCGEEGLSVLNTRKVMGLMYGVGDGELGYKECPNKLNVFYDMDNDRVYGICYEPDVKMAGITLKIGEEQDYDSFMVNIDDKGFFVKENAAKAMGLKTLDELESGTYSAGVFAQGYDILGEDAHVTSNMPKGLVSIYDAVPGPAYPVDWSFLLDAPEGELSVDVVNQFNRIILPRSVIDDDMQINTNMMYCFIKPEGGVSEDLRLQDILWEFPRYEEMTPELWNALKSTPEWKEYGKEWTHHMKVFGNQTPHGGVAAYDGKTVRDALKYYTELDIKDINRNGVIYSESEDVYYSMTHYADGGFLFAEGGEKDGYTVTFYVHDWWGNEENSLKLREYEGRYIIEEYYDALAEGARNASAR